MDSKNIKYKNKYEYKGYILIKDNNKYIFIILKEEATIKIKCDKYSILLNIKELSLLTHKIFKSIDESYNFIIDIFDKNKAIIKKIIEKMSINLILKYNSDNKEKESLIDITLNYYINDEIDNNLLNNVLNDFNKINIKNKNIIKKEKKIENKVQNKIINNKLDFEFLKDLVYDSYCRLWLDNTFCVFKSLDNLLYLIYTNENNSIILYNIVDEKQIGEIKNAHVTYITNYRYFLDNIRQRDLIMSISAYDNNLKIWNIDDLNCLLSIQNENIIGQLFSACFLTNNTQIYIIISYYHHFKNNQPIQVYSLKGEKIMDINDSQDKTKFIDSYYDSKLDTHYIISGNEGYIKSFNFEINELYHKYYSHDYYNIKSIDSIIIYEDEIVKMIESCCDGNIRIWDFHLGELLKIININNYSLKGICLWDNNFLWVSCEDRKIKLLELNEGIILKELGNKHVYELTVKKINHPIYGECLISQGDFNNGIKLWKIKNK